MRTIKYYAVVCRYCGRQLDTDGPVSASPPAQTSSGAAVLGAIGILSGAVGLLVFGLPLGGLAVVCGIVAVAMGPKSGVAASSLGLSTPLALDCPELDVLALPNMPLQLTRRRAESRQLGSPEKSGPEERPVSGLWYNTSLGGT